MLRQFFTVSRISLSNFRSRAVPALVIVAGLMAVSVAMLPILSLGEGLRLSYLDAGDPGRAWVLAAGAQTLAGSRIAPDLAARVMQAPGIARADAERTSWVKLTKRGSTEQGGTHLQGFGANGIALRPEMTLVAGRLPRAGKQEALAGVLAARKFVGLSIGDRAAFAGTRWTVVGHYRTGGTLDGDLVVDAPLLMRALGQSPYSGVLVRLSSDAAFPAFREAVTRLAPVQVVREPDYYRGLWQQVPAFPYVVAYGLGLLIGMGALTGTLHTMHNAVAARAGEIVLLRAVGFDARAVAASVVAEAVALAALGAVLGAGIDWLWLHGYAYNGGIDGGVFEITVTGHVLSIALGWAVAIALMGALGPARRAARGTVAEALRDL